MKNRYSTIAILTITILLSVFRIHYGKMNVQNYYKVTTWDALGYYMYLPSAFIYQDFKELKWLDSLDSKYALTGGSFYQASKLPSGTYTNKYLCGVALMQMPFFLIAHEYTIHHPDSADGFSTPYQLAVILAALFWTIIGLLFLRIVLRQFFDETTTVLSLLMLAFCTNLIQYVSIDSGQSHCYIFSLYAIVLWASNQWHKNPRIISAAIIGFTCGLACISRPTELIIICIPIFWLNKNKNDNTTLKDKFFIYKTHIFIAIIAGLISILPQILYWHHTTGNYIYDVGSKWNFLNPWFRVLLGPEKGWFLYTPIAIGMVIGLFFMKKYPFHKSVILFCLLNIWIVISWSDWRYGGSYSTRALVQSYPVFTLALASLIDTIKEKKKLNYLYAIGIFLVVLNFYQLGIYNNGVGEGFSPFVKQYFISK